jgi:hypothetical protein
MVVLPILHGYTHGFAYGIGNDGTIAGESRTPGSRACIWRHHVLADLNHLIPQGSGLLLTAGIVINNRGQILCEGSHQSGKVAVILTPIFAPVADVTLDCIVNVNDLLGVINAWGQTGGPADVNQDGIVNHLDLLLVIQNWTFI